jgi:hypothetical protein
MKMRRTLLSALVCGALTVSAFAQEAPVRPGRAARPAPNVLFGDQVENTFLLPVVGNTAGAQNTFFRSAVVISNYRDTSQRIAIRVLREGVNSGSDPVLFRTLPAYLQGGDLGLVDDDFLASLGKSGLAAVLVSAVDANGNPDTAGRLDGSSRNYTVQPSTDTCSNPSGQVSQYMLAVRPSMIQGTQFSTFTSGMRQDENFRTNVGIVNLSNDTHTWVIDVFGTRGETDMTVSVAGNSMSQFALPAGNYGTMVIDFTLVPDSTTTATSPNWSAYGTSVDNRTGDSWFRTAAY